MPTDSSRSTGGLDDLVAAARAQEDVAATTPAGRRRPRRIPSRRVLTAGGMVLRGIGVLLVIAGCWPFLWTLLEAYVLLGGEKSVFELTISGQEFSLHMRGWPAIIFGLICSAALWCAAIVAFALGHAIYAIRDLALGVQAMTK
jgi:hypothetical protein